MLQAVLWGLVQGLTEFLPISSSGHLVLVPSLLGLDAPDLATSAVLHLGTLVAVLIYFRAEVGQMARFSRDGRRLLRLLVIGSIPAVAAGLAFKSKVESLNDTPRAVAVAMIVTGVWFLATRWLPGGARKTAEANERDAIGLGIGQALALVPGVSRSGMTISAGLLRTFDRAEAARFSFILGIPAIAGAGLLELLDLASSDAGVPASTWVGMVVAAVAGYAAIATLLRLIRATGLAPFGAYCVAFGVLSLILV